MSTGWCFRQKCSRMQPPVSQYLTALSSRIEPACGPAPRLRDRTGRAGFRIEAFCCVRRQRLEFRHGVGNSGADIELCEHRWGIAFIHTGQFDHFVDQQPHAFPFAADILQPFIFPDFGFHNIQIGKDECERGFQLMVCVCDKLFLLFVAVRYRADGPLGDNVVRIRIRAALPRRIKNAEHSWRNVIFRCILPLTKTSIVPSSAGDALYR